MITLFGLLLEFFCPHLEHFVWSEASLPQSIVYFAHFPVLPKGRVSCYHGAYAHRPVSVYLHLWLGSQDCNLLLCHSRPLLRSRPDRYNWICHWLAVTLHSLLLSDYWLPPACRVLCTFLLYFRVTRNTTYWCSREFPGCFSSQIKDALQASSTQTGDSMITAWRLGPRLWYREQLLSWLWCRASKVGIILAAITININPHWRTMLILFAILLLHKKGKRIFWRSTNSKSICTETDLLAPPLWAAWAQ